MRFAVHTMVIAAALLASVPPARASLVVQDGASDVLGAYTYDAFGRRISATVGGTTRLFYFDGQREIEERNAAGTVTAYHINGAQYIDERIATWRQSINSFRYYLLGDNFSTVGTGGANGAALDISRSAAGVDGTGDCAFCNDCGHPQTCPGDVDGDGFVNVNDLGALLASFNKSIGHPDYNPCADFDVDGSGCDGTVNIADQGVLLAEFGTTCASQDCPPVGQTVFTLHGRPIETLPDGKTLLHVRAWVYDPQHGRWLQRDPSGYVDGANLYESFGSNATRNVDPSASPFFSMGQTLDETIAALSTGRLTASDLPTIRVFELEGRLFSLDNRRLIAFKSAQVPGVPIQAVDPSDPAIQRLLFGPRGRFNPIRGEGEFIIIAPSGERAAAEAVLRSHGLISR